MFSVSAWNESHGVRIEARKARRLCVATPILLVLGCLALACARPDRRAVPRLVDLSAAFSVPVYEVTADSGGPSLKVMTLNLAHGKGTGSHQLFQGTATHRANLEQIKKVISRENPHVVALQEADGSSFWSGNFNHVDYLARGGGYSYYLQFENARGMGLSYGTALVSVFPLNEPFGLTFETAAVTAPKGFLVSMIEWPGYPGFEVDFVSVHLDPLSDRIRREQIDEFIHAMSDRNRPLIVMGDFNCEWMDNEKTLRRLAEVLDLKTFRPDATDIATFRSVDRRLDWILVSSEFEFVSHHVLADSISDHQGVVAEISLRSMDSG